MTRFFLRRPVFAAVASIIVFIAGLVSLPTLPIAQFPKVAPPEVTVVATYIGANAATVESAVTTPLEESINGIEGLRYMTSVSGNNGSSTITVTFNLGRDLDAAQADVQNAVLSATGHLPATVQQTGVIVKKSSPAIILGLGLLTDGRLSQNELGDFAEHHVINTLKRIPGVADVQIFGIRRYAMRIWLDPRRLQSQNLTAVDVITALQSQNQLVASGALGSEPTNGQVLYQVQLSADGRLKTAKEFENIIIRSAANGGLVRLADVGRAELGSEDYNTLSRWNGQECVGFGIIQSADANALDVATKARATVHELEKTFPPGVTSFIPFDVSLFVRESINEVIFTLALAILLVVIVIYVFIQDWKMTLVPVITIPVSLVGTFALMKMFGFSINTLTLFGLTLATGLVVDDAIVVIENIARFVQDKKMAPLQAAEEAMKEISGAVVATSLVLLAVFVPVAFFPGSTGVLYKQFALTIACSIAISLFTALTLAPPLSAMLLRPSHEVSAPFFVVLNRGISSLRNWYHGFLPRVIKLRAFMALLFVAALAATGIVYSNTPTSFIPDEDQGYFIVIMQTPVGTSADYERRASAKVAKILLKNVPEAEGVFSADGFGFTGVAPNRGLAFLPLKPWKDREGPSHTAQAIIGRLYAVLGSNPEALVFPVNPPSVQGIGSVGGFQLEVLDQNQIGYDVFGGATYGLIGAMNQDHGAFASAYTQFGNNVPQFNLAVDRNAVESLGIGFGSVAQTLGVLEGSEYVNDFNLKDRSYRVYVQADAKYRSDLSSLNSMYVRSPNNGLTPLSSLLTPTAVKVPTEISHFNLFRSIEVDGAPAPGVSSGDVIAAVRGLAAHVLPPGLSYEWFGLTRDQIEGGNLAALIFALGIVFVFLVLAAQYENFWDPFVILLSVPLAILGALLAIGLRHFPSDVFVQVGLVMLIGLASKNAILIVEFANQLKATGMTTIAAVARAAETRLRPIIMTSLAFIFGILPLVWATGAGSASRNSLGTAVFGGMLISTVLNLIFVPVIYVIIASLRERVSGRRGVTTAHTPLRDAIIGWFPMKREGAKTEWLPVYAEQPTSTDSSI